MSKGKKNSVDNVVAKDIILQLLLRLLVNSIQGAVCNTYQIMPDMNQTIGDFSGECEVGGEANKWFNNLTITTELHKLSTNLR